MAGYSAVTPCDHRKFKFLQGGAPDGDYDAPQRRRRANVVDSLKAPY